GLRPRPLRLAESEAAARLLGPLRDKIVQAAPAPGWHRLRCRLLTRHRLLRENGEDHADQAQTDPVDDHRRALRPVDRQRPEDRWPDEASDVAGRPIQAHGDTAEVGWRYVAEIRAAGRPADAGGQRVARG